MAKPRALTPTQEADAERRFRDHTQREIATVFGVSTSAVQNLIKRSGVPYPSKVGSSAHREAVRQAAILRGEATAKGTRITPSGYVEYTRGPHKGRLVHVVMIEQELGRRLAPGEEVHHKDEVRHNNERSNLELLTHAEHSRLHRLAKPNPRDAATGRFVAKGE